MSALRRKGSSLPRALVVLITALVIDVPLAFIVIQRFQSAPFFVPSKVFSLDAFRFIFADADFWRALKSGLLLAFGLVIIAILLGGILAFLMVRTDLPGRRVIEPLILVPVFVSPRVLAFGYVVAAGPIGIFSLWAQALLSFTPWNIYAMSSIIVIAGLTHVPHAYLYISSALRSVGFAMEEAARTVGASPLQVMFAISLPMVRPAILYAVVLLFSSGWKYLITRHVTVPLSRFGLIGFWLLMFLIFEREYSTGVYLLSSGTETIGSMRVSLWAAGAIDIVAALSFINILQVVLGLGIALRFGMKLYD